MTEYLLQTDTHLQLLLQALQHLPRLRLILLLQRPQALLLLVVQRGLLLLNILLQALLPAAALLLKVLPAGAAADESNTAAVDDTVRQAPTQANDFTASARPSRYALGCRWHAVVCRQTPQAATFALGHWCDAACMMLLVCSASAAAAAREAHL